MAQLEYNVLNPTVSRGRLVLHHAGGSDHLSPLDTQALLALLIEHMPEIKRYSSLQLAGKSDAALQAQHHRDMRKQEREELDYVEGIEIASGVDIRQLLG